MGSGKINIWMPLCVGELFVDTALLTTEQFGAYIQLLLHLWTRDGLPDNDEILARITGLSASEWTRNRSMLEQQFTIADGVWTSGYVDRERKRALKVHAQNSKRAHAGALARWKKHPENSN